jgi:O-antigen ligase
VERTDGDDTAVAWWPELRRIDLTGLALVAAFVVWVVLSARATDGRAGPMVGLVLGAVAAAALTRWATHVHATGPAAAIAVVLLGYGLVTGEPDTGDAFAAERLGALLVVGTGAAAVVAVRASELWLRLTGGVATLALAVLTWRTGSTPAALLAVVVVVGALALVLLPMRERRWVVVWPGLVAVLLLFGSTAYASLPLPAELVGGAPSEERLEGWTAALDAVTEAPLFGTGPAAPGPTGVGLTSGTNGWASSEPLQVLAETGVIGGLLFLALLWWAVAWVARPGGGPGSVVGGVVVAGTIAHACLAPIWHGPAVPLALAALAGAASLRGGVARGRLDALVSGRRGDDGDADRRLTSPRDADGDPVEA